MIRLLLRPIRLLLRPIRIRRARAAYDAAAKDRRDAHERQDTRALHEANRRAKAALHAFMAAERGR